MLSLVLAGGELTTELDTADLGAVELIVAADGGVALARDLGLAPTLVVGDFDSARPDDLDWARAEGADLVRHEVDKDRTDLELALDAVGRAGGTRVIVLGLGGGRVDHELGNWSAVAAADLPRVEVRGAGGTTYVVRREIELEIEVGRLVSILPWGGPAVVTTEGLRWELETEELSPFEARGVSNVVDEAPARIAVASGVVFVVCPDEG